MLSYIQGQVAQCQPSRPMDELEHTYDNLSRNFREEYILYNLAAVAVSQVARRL